MDLEFILSLPIGDKASGRIPSIKAVSVHPDPTIFNGGNVEMVLGVLTSEAVVIYHNNMTSWEKILRHRWTKDVVVNATTLQWHPRQPELFVGDEEGHISIFKYEKIEDEATWSYTFQCVFTREKQRACSLSWSGDGKYLVAAFNHDVVVFHRYKDGFKKKIITPQRGPCDYIVKFHPNLPYFFVCASNSPSLKVFTNLGPDMKLQQDWMEVNCSDCGFGIRAICCDESHQWELKSSMFLATAGKCTTVWRFHHAYKGNDGVIHDPKLQVVNKLEEENANSVAFHSVVKKYMVCGFDNGLVSIYTGTTGTPKRDARQTYKGLVFVQPNRKFPDHKLINPEVTCLASEPPGLDTDFIFVGGSHGFVQIFKLIYGKHTTEALATKMPTESIQRDIEGEIHYYDENMQKGLGVIGTHHQIATSSSMLDILESMSMPSMPMPSIPGQEQQQQQGLQEQQQQQGLQGLKATCLELQQVVNKLHKQLQPNLPAAHKMPPKDHMPSPLSKQQEEALQSTCVSSQDLLQKLQKVLQLI